MGTGQSLARRSRTANGTGHEAHRRDAKPVDAGHPISFDAARRQRGPRLRRPATSASRCDGSFLLTQMVAVAELEAGLVSERTKAALAAAQRKGTKLGNPNLAKASASGVASIRRNADAFAKQVLPVIREVQQGGARSLRAIAQALKARLLPRNSAKPLDRSGVFGCEAARKSAKKADQTIGVGVGRGLKQCLHLVGRPSWMNCDLILCKKVSAQSLIQGRQPPNR